MRAFVCAAIGAAASVSGSVDPATVREARPPPNSEVFAAEVVLPARLARAGA